MGRDRPDRRHLARLGARLPPAPRDRVPARAQRSPLAPRRALPPSLAFGVGSAFLAGEIAVQERPSRDRRTPSSSAGCSRYVRSRASAAGALEARRGRGAGRGSMASRAEASRGSRRSDRAPRAPPFLRPSARPGPSRARRTMPRGRPLATRASWRPTGAKRARRPTNRETRRPPFTRDQFRRLRKMGRRTTANVATGDFAADFERRWRLRVPRYGLIYLALILIGLGSRAFLVGRQREREAARPRAPGRAARGRARGGASDRAEGPAPPPLPLQRAALGRRSHPLGRPGPGPHGARSDRRSASYEPRRRRGAVRHPRPRGRAPAPLPRRRGPAISGRSCAWSSPSIRASRSARSPRSSRSPSSRTP